MNELSEELLEACQKGDLKRVRYLLTSSELKEHADIYHKSDSGWNALIYAYFNGYMDIAKYLILEQNMQIDQNTQEIIEINQYDELINMINTRDRYHHINEKLYEKNTEKNNLKQRKI